jgi:hypothetical protein
MAMALFPRLLRELKNKSGRECLQASVAAQKIVSCKCYLMTAEYS